LAPERARNPFSGRPTIYRPQGWNWLLSCVGETGGGYDDDTVLELAFEDTKAVETVAARINGRPAEVRMYSHSRGGACGSYYPDRTGNVDPGAVELVLDLEWP
jgi:hypothetical protein